MRRSYKKISFIIILLSVCLLFFVPLSGCARYELSQVAARGISLSDIPDWDGRAYIEIDGNIPSFSKTQREKKTSFVKYYSLDEYGRPVKAFGRLGTDTLNDKEREGIGQIKPVGWETKQYADIIADRFVYNRCHLLMQAAASGIKKEECNGYHNLITGTRYMNVDGMLPFESRMLSYIRRTGNHVLYRVTPVYKDSELVARGVHMEAYSVEDEGKGIRFNIYCYNIQPGIKIDYRTGKTSKKSDPYMEMRQAVQNGATTVNEAGIKSEDDTDAPSATSGKLDDTSKADDAREYVLNTNTKRFHYPGCSSVDDMKEKNKWSGTFSRSELIEHGYKACGRCHP